MSYWNHPCALLTLSIATLWSTLAASRADEARVVEGHRPKICTGYTEEQEVLHEGMQIGGICSKHSAVLEVVSAAGMNRKAAAEVLLSYTTCCPLPSTDILTEQHVLASASCPKAHIVTGQVLHQSQGEVRSQLHCTKINTERYRLAEAQPGRHWGFGASSWKEQYRIMREDLPPAFRNGLGRVSRYRRNSHGCVGYPIGSVLVARNHKRCFGYSFRQLQFLGRGSDPPQGTPVELFPRCRHILKSLSTNPICVTEGGD